MINDLSQMRSKRLKIAYNGASLKTEMKIPSIHKYKLSLDSKKSPKARRKPKGHSTRGGIKQSPEANILLTERPINTSYRQLKGFISTKHTKNSSMFAESPYNSSNLLFLRKIPAKTKVNSTSVEDLQDLKVVMTGQDVLRLKSEMLSEFEVKEISNFDQVYCLGNPKNKICADENEANWGFDDEELNYKVILGDHLFYRFEILGILGKGSFGVVCKCLDHKTGMTVAVKIIKNKQKFHKQGAVEVKVLKHLNENDQEDYHNIVRMLASFNFRSHLCIVFELLSINLYDFLKVNHFQGLTLALVRCFAIQLLICLKFTSFHNIIHCDLKPENILLRDPTRAAIKVIDYGSSCYTQEQIYTYIQSRFYRAPEIMLGIPYTPAIDIWSYGCILIELYTGYPLFPGESENDQMLRIMEVLGTPPSDLVALATRKKHFFDGNGEPKLVPNSKGKVRIPGSKPLREIIEVHDQGFIEFVLKALTWDFRVRATADDLLSHPWINENQGNKRTARKGNSFFSEDYSKSRFH